MGEAGALDGFSGECSPPFPSSTSPTPAFQASSPSSPPPPASSRSLDPLPLEGAAAIFLTTGCWCRADVGDGADQESSHRKMGENDDDEKQPAGELEKSRTSAGMPRDVIADVLARLPVKSLCRCKAVCKPWCALLSDPSFVRLHLGRSKRGSSGSPVVLLTPTMYQYPCLRLLSYRLGSRGGPDLFFQTDISSTPRRPLVLRHCDGLVLLAIGPRSYVCNPRTREVARLPAGTPHGRRNPYGIGERMGLGFDPLEGNYKVVRLFFRSEEIVSMGCEVLTLGGHGRPSRWSWQPVAGHLPHPTDPKAAPVFSEGHVYFMVHGGNPIVCLSLQDGKFDYVPQPPPSSSGCNHLISRLNMESATLLEDDDGKLGLVYVLEARRHDRKEVASIVELWALVHRQRRTWHCRYAVKVPKLPELFEPLAVLRGGKLVFRARLGLGCWNPAITTSTGEAGAGAVDVEPVAVDVPPVGDATGITFGVTCCQACTFVETLVSVR